MLVSIHDGALLREKTWTNYLRIGTYVMRFQLQFGFGMMDHSKVLVKEWGAGEVILSPRDLTSDQLDRLSLSIRSHEGGSVVLDPQFYLPHADHERLREHRYWPASYETSSFFGGPALTTLVTTLRDLNNRLQTRAFILPGLLAERVTDDWLATQRLILEEATAHSPNEIYIQTIALSDDASRNTADIAQLIEHCAANPAQGYYIVVQHPQGDYLVDDAIWLANVIDLCAALKLQGSQVVLGYCNQQMLIASLAKIDAIASGTWMNVRSFPPEKFKAANEEETRKRATWFYCPQTLSEYKIPFLDIAQRQQLLSELYPDAPNVSQQVRNLFAGGQPSSIGLTEQAAFRHYLTCLQSQAAAIEQSTFDATVDAYRLLLDRAEGQLDRLHRIGVRGQNRDFSEVIETNRAAVEVLISERGPRLRRLWATL